MFLRTLKPDGENVTSNINKYSFLFTLLLENYLEYQYVLPALDLKHLCTKLTFKLITVLKRFEYDR